MAGRASPVLDAVTGLSRGFEGGGRERQRGSVAGTERGGDRRAGAHKQELAEEVVELDRDAEPVHGLRGNVLKEDEMLDQTRLLAGGGGARLLDDDHRIARLGWGGERHGEAQGREVGLHAPAG
jgi:hypothetical protein